VIVVDVAMNQYKNVTKKNANVALAIIRDHLQKTGSYLTNTSKSSLIIVD